MWRTFYFNMFSTRDEDRFLCSRTEYVNRLCLPFFLFYDIHTHIHAHIYVSLYVYTYLLTYVCMYACVDVYTHVHYILVSKVLTCILVRCRLELSTLCLLYYS